ncbi:hypothetical protein PM082_022668 [Marasmius tenuissimus]|nr:hypothetical protein PM082_001902 [Marasmius tenuissimus]KAJ8077479.1 hypothetical protein PM082_001909 [Marasmius tenuissimus]KAJ8095638.1 hypothetical protein PM082_023045 [Marasmius tenuissimus]KAJ8096054.1 hypothetical protein PM082_022668 [Marasmius tenuissimus]
MGTSIGPFPAFYLLETPGFRRATAEPIVPTATEKAKQSTCWVRHSFAILESTGHQLPVPIYTVWRNTLCGQIFATTKPRPSADMNSIRQESHKSPFFSLTGSPSTYIHQGSLDFLKTSYSEFRRASMSLNAKIKRSRDLNYLRLRDIYDPACRGSSIERTN